MPFFPDGNGLFVLYYGELLGDKGALTKDAEKIVTAAPNFLVVADVYFANALVPRTIHEANTTIRVLAYIATSYGNLTSFEAVLGMIRSAMLSGYDGIFFDEVSDGDDRQIVNFYFRITNEVRLFGSNKLVIFNPGVIALPGWHFDAADIVSVENAYDDTPRIKDGRSVSAWRLLAVQGDPAGNPANDAPGTAGEAIDRLMKARNNGIFWYYSSPISVNHSSTHWRLLDDFEQFADRVKALFPPSL